MSLCSHVFHVFKLFAFPMVYEMMVTCYPLVENGNINDVGIRRKGILCGFGHALCLWFMYVTKEGKLVKTMCKSLTCEWKKKRTMRSNRRESWGSWNLPP